MSKTIVLASEPVGRRSGATELPCFNLLLTYSTPKSLFPTNGHDRHFMVEGMVIISTHI